MPELGEQHNNATTNPFEEVKIHVSEYTAAEIATLSSRLEKQLGPEYISSRAGPGGSKVHYLSADKCINLANEVFGFNGWSSSIQAIQMDFVDETDQGRVSLGLSVTLRVTLRDGTYHEDIGYGHIENCKGKAAAFEKAKKEGTTDALKRTLRNFGNLLGNCIYDKDYVAKVTKLKKGPAKWDPDNLHRHPDFAPVSKEPSRDTTRQQNNLPRAKQESSLEGEKTQGILGGFAEDEFGSDDFDAVDFAVSNGDHPDEVIVDGSKSSDRFTRRPALQKKDSQAQIRPAELNNTPKPPSPSSRNTGLQTLDTRQQPEKFQGPSLNESNNSNLTPAYARHTHRNSVDQPPKEPLLQELSEPAKDELPMGFFTARAAESLQAGPNRAFKATLFNPRLESPSIRKTAGVDHTRTKPVNRDLTEGAAPPPAATTGPFLRENVVISQIDRGRRVGMPIGTATPMPNRGLYRPPQIKRAGDEGALRDVTAASINVGDTLEPKRQKVAGNIESEANDGLLKV